MPQVSPRWPQATIGSSGLTPWAAVARCFSSVQSRAANLAWSAEAAASGDGVADGVGALLSSAFFDSLAEGEGVGLPGALRASLSARP
ncbi:hypothetical protein GCM10020254_67170 [Streptomyces goshikiensis]